MINVDYYINRLDFLKLVLEVWIDYWIDVKVLEETKQGDSWLKMINKKTNEQ